ncbi:reverse transcriptase domain-containing protein, partial [Tanacetum coccineum]
IDADRPRGKIIYLCPTLRIRNNKQQSKIRNSQLLVNQIKGTYAAKQPTIREYLLKTKEALRDFDSYTIEHIRRNQNKKVDALSKLASMTFEHLTKELLVEVLPKRSIEEKEILQVETKERESWMTHIHEYLVSVLLPEDPKESRKIRVKAPQYKLIRGNMYLRSFYTLWLRCLASPQTDDIVKEVHEGSYGFNAEPRSIVVKITKQGYYWPSMHQDAAKVLQDCEKCKEQSAIRKTAEGSAITAGSGWPFSHWGINILGPLPTAPGDLCKGLKVTQSFSPITEHMKIMNHTEKQLARSQQGWVDDLAQVLWVHRTLPRNSQKETPFSLTYGSGAIIPISENDVAKDDRGRIKEVNKRRGSKEIASIEEAYYQSKLRRKHAGMVGSSHDKRSSRRGTLQNCRCIRSLVDPNSKEYEPSLEDIMKWVATLHLKIEKISQKFKATHEPPLDKAQKGVRLKVLQIPEHD